MEHVRDQSTFGEPSSLLAFGWVRCRNSGVIVVNRGLSHAAFSHSPGKYRIVRLGISLEIARMPRYAYPRLLRRLFLLAPRYPILLIGVTKHEVSVFGSCCDNFWAVGVYRLLLDKLHTRSCLLRDLAVEKRVSVLRYEALPQEDAQITFPVILPFWRAFEVRYLRQRSLRKKFRRALHIVITRGILSPIDSWNVLGKIDPNHGLWLRPEVIFVEDFDWGEELLFELVF